MANTQDTPRGELDIMMDVPLWDSVGVENGISEETMRDWGYTDGPQGAVGEATVRMLVKLPLSEFAEVPLRQSNKGVPRFSNGDFAVEEIQPGMVMPNWGPVLGKQPSELELEKLEAIRKQVGADYGMGSNIRNFIDTHGLPVAKYLAGIIFARRYNELQLAKRAGDTEQTYFAGVRLNDWKRFATEHKLRKLDKTK